MNLEIKFPVNTNKATNQEVTELANMLQFNLKVPFTRDVEMQDPNRYGMLNGLSMSHLNPNIFGALHTVLKYYQEQKPYYLVVIQDGTTLHDMAKLPLEEFKSVAGRAIDGIQIAVNQRENAN